MMKHNTIHKNDRKILRLIAILLVACFLPAFALAEEAAGEDSDWVTFFLMCNEGMTNDGGNTGNTMMLVSMKPNTGEIRLLVFMWDTFVYFEGYDVPQRIGMPYRSSGPEETMKVFNDNFDMDVNLYMSLNYLNLASLIDTYGGVDVDVTRAERNALNGMVSSKKNKIQDEVDSGLLGQMAIELLADEYYLNDYGPDTHLNGLQAVGFGWLQYDSVYNCCLRELSVISKLFASLGASVSKKVAFYTNDTDYPEGAEGKRVVNLDEITEDDYTFLRELINPIFEKSFNNLSEDDINSISAALIRTAYLASRHGLNVFSSVKTTLLPLEAEDEYDIIAGTKGHIVDTKANSEAMKAFLFAEDND